MVGIISLLWHTSILYYPVERISEELCNNRKYCKIFNNNTLVRSSGMYAEEKFPQSTLTFQFLWLWTRIRDHSLTLNSCRYSITKYISILVAQSSKQWEQIVLRQGARGNSPSWRWIFSTWWSNFVQISSAAVLSSTATSSLGKYNKRRRRWAISSKRYKFYSYNAGSQERRRRFYAVVGAQKRTMGSEFIVPFKMSPQLKEIFVMQQ